MDTFKLFFSFEDNSRKKVIREVRERLKHSDDLYTQYYIHILWDTIHEKKWFNREERKKTSWLFKSIGYSNKKTDQKSPTYSSLYTSIQNTLKGTDKVELTPILTPTIYDSINVNLNNTSLHTWSDHVVYKLFSSLSEQRHIFNHNSYAKNICSINKLILNILTTAIKNISTDYKNFVNRVWVFLFRDKHQLTPDPSDDHSDATYLKKICKLHFIGMNSNEVKSWDRKNISQRIIQNIKNKLMSQNSNLLILDVG